MDIYELIKKCSSLEELYELADSAIKFFTQRAYEENVPTNCIGTQIGINPISNHIGDKDFKFDKYYNAVNVWNGYVPLGMKIVYGRFFNEKYKTSSHKGAYYYLDDDSYVYEFFKYLKDKDIEDEYDLIIEVDHFIKKKFFPSFMSRDRNEINKLIYKDEDFFYKPVKEHSIKDFYGNGSAMCSEVSIVAENLLSVLGLEVISMQDRSHAYNIYVYHMDEETEIYVLDYSDWVGCYDCNFNLVDTIPFLKKIENCTADDVDEIVNEGKRITLNDYYLYMINGKIYEVITKKKRDYGIDFGLKEEKTLILKKKTNK